MFICDIFRKNKLDGEKLSPNIAPVELSKITKLFPEKKGFLSLCDIYGVEFRQFSKKGERKAEYRIHQIFKLSVP